MCRVPGVRISLTSTNYRRHRALGLPGFNAQVLEQGQSPRQDITEVVTVSAPADIAQKLDLDEGSPVVVRRRVFNANDVPVALTDSYFPADLARVTAIEQPGRIKGGVHTVIEDENGPIRRASRVPRTTSWPGCPPRTRRASSACPRACQ